MAVVVDMVFDAAGTLASSDLYPALVKNRAKLAYGSVAAWLEGTGPAPRRIAETSGLDENLRAQDRVAQKLAERRHQHGALTLESLEAKAVFDGDDISDLVLDRKNRAKQIIEDFMIAANGATAKFLDAKGFPSLRRVLRSPERWGRIKELASRYGEQLPGESDAAALEGFLAKRRLAAPERFPDLSLAVVKLIGRGEYAVDRPGAEPPGHFGLAVRDYTHSTAPNRRFPDLITSRMLKAKLASTQPPYSVAELEALARHCTQQEDAAQKVERRVRKSEAALLLESHVGESFDAIVTGHSTSDTWVRIFSPPAEGRLDSDVPDIEVGQQVRVKLVSTNVERGFIDFVWLN